MQRLKYILLCLLFINGSGKLANGQESTNVVLNYSKDNYREATDSLNRLYGRNKKLIEGYELQILLALSHYPELIDKHIDFIYKKTLIPLASRPRLSTTIRKKEHWVYKVIISNESLDAMEPVLLKNLPFNAQVGIIGHELAHTVYYQDKGFFQILSIGLMYFFPNFRANFERNTVKRAIQHGLGWQLLEYAQFVREKAREADYSYDEMEKFYLNPKEIKIVMTKLSIY